MFFSPSSSSAMLRDEWRNGSGMLATSGNGTRRQKKRPTTVVAAAAMRCKSEELVVNQMHGDSLWGLCVVAGIFFLLLLNSPAPPGSCLPEQASLFVHLCVERGEGVAWSGWVGNRREEGGNGMRRMGIEPAKKKRQGSGSESHERNRFRFLEGVKAWLVSVKSLTG